MIVMIQEVPRPRVVTGTWKDYPSLRAAREQSLPDRVHGLQRRASTTPYRVARIVVHTEGAIKNGDQHLPLYAHETDLAMARDVAALWRALDTHARHKSFTVEKVRFNFASAGYSADEALKQKLRTISSFAALKYWLEVELMPPPALDLSRRGTKRKSVGGSGRLSGKRMDRSEPGLWIKWLTAGNLDKKRLLMPPSALRDSFGWQASPQQGKKPPCIMLSYIEPGSGTQRQVDAGMLPLCGDGYRMGKPTQTVLAKLGAAGGDTLRLRQVPNPTDADTIYVAVELEKAPPAADGDGGGGSSPGSAGGHGQQQLQLPSPQQQEEEEEEEYSASRRDLTDEEDAGMDDAASAPQPLLPPPLGSTLGGRAEEVQAAAEGSPAAKVPRLDGMPGVSSGGAGDGGTPLGTAAGLPPSDGGDGVNLVLQVAAAQLAAPGAASLQAAAQEAAATQAASAQAAPPAAAATQSTPQQAAASVGAATVRPCGVTQSPERQPSSPAGAAIYHTAAALELPLGWVADLAPQPAAALEARMPGGVEGGEAPVKKEEPVAAAAPALAAVALAAAANPAGDSIGLAAAAAATAPAAAPQAAGAAAAAAAGAAALGARAGAHPLEADLTRLAEVDLNNPLEMLTAVRTLLSMSCLSPKVQRAFRRVFFTCPLDKQQMHFGELRACYSSQNMEELEAWVQEFV